MSDDDHFRPKPGRIRSDASKAGQAKSFLTKVRKIARQHGARLHLVDSVDEIAGTLNADLAVLMITEVNYLLLDEAARRQNITVTQGEVDKLIGRVAHCGYDDYQLVAFLIIALDAVRDALDALGIAYRSATEFLDKNFAHNKKKLRQIAKSG